MSKALLAGRDPLSRERRWNLTVGLTKWSAPARAWRQAAESQLDKTRLYAWMLISQMISFIARQRDKIIELCYFKVRYQTFLARFPLK
jgi:hypothetical protein